MAEKSLWKPAGRRRWEGTVGTPASQRPVGIGAGETPKSPNRPDSLSPTSPVRSNWTQINGHAGSFQKRRNLYQVGAGAVSTVSTNIYTYLHRLQTGSRVVYTATAGRAGEGRGGRRGLAENNKYHFLPPLTGRFGTGGRGPRGPRGWGGTRGGSRDWGTIYFDSCRGWRVEDPDGFEAREGETRTGPRGLGERVLGRPLGLGGREPRRPSGLCGDPGRGAASGRPHYLGQ